MLQPAVVPNWPGKVLRTLYHGGAVASALRLWRSRAIFALEDGPDDLTVQLDVLLANGCLAEAFQLQVRRLTLPSRRPTAPAKRAGPVFDRAATALPQRQYRYVGPFTLLSRLVQYFFQPGMHWATVRAHARAAMRCPRCPHHSSLHGLATRRGDPGRRAATAARAAV